MLRLIDESASFTHRPTQDRSTLRWGFTLLEVLLVLGILVVIAAMVVPNLLGRQKEALVRTTKIDIAGFEKAAQLYASAHDGEFPSGDAETVVELMMSDTDENGKPQDPFLTKIPLDAWKQPLQYEYPPGGNQGIKGKPAIWSYGPDKQDGTDDDINNWDPEE